MDSKAPQKYRLGVTLRAVLVGLLLMPLNSYWVFMMEVIRYQGHPTTISLFFSSIFILILLILANSLIRRYAPRWVFSQGELITIYVMLNIGSALIGHDSMQILVSLMAFATRYASPENGCKELFVDKLPDWLVVKDPFAIRKFYSGGDFYDPANYGPWVVPVLCWSAFIIVLVLMFLCINVLLRKQWTEREKLSYPLVQLPLDMTAEKTPLFKEPLLWWGFGIVAAIDILNGLHVLYPSFPQIPIKLPENSQYFTSRPWNFIGTLPTQFYPFGIGLGMLLPVDLLFSCWFFFWVWKAERILTAVFGLETIPGMPFEPEQSFGAYMGIAFFAIMVSRRHFINIFRHFFGMKSDVDDTGEPISYNAAVWILILGSAFLFVFASKAGMPLYLIIPFFVIYFGMSVAITRMRAELGLPAHDLHAAGPDRLIPVLMGHNNVGVRGLNTFSLFFWFNRAYRSHVMPFQLEGFKMAEKIGMSYRRLFFTIIAATAVGTFLAFWIMLHLLYEHGAASSSIGPLNVAIIFGWEPWSRMEGWVKSPLPPDTSRAMAISVGFLVTIALNTLRMRIGWFPFHPVGYAVSSTWSMQLLWLPLFIAWIIKLVILRYGGLKLYRQALPFFLGVILAECVVGSLWTVIGIILRVPSYAFWP